MLIRITNKCRMGCTHCMVDATPEGGNMTREVYIEALKLTRRLDEHFVMLTGGEPTDHPEILEFVDLAQLHGVPFVFLTTNGMFMKERPELIAELNHRKVFVQITNDERYYPIKVDKPADPSWHYEDRIRTRSPFGRAKTNAISCNRVAPLCFNLRSAVRHLASMRLALETLRARGTYCTPSINIDGKVVAGEAPSCSVVGTVDSSDGELSHGVASLRCSRCGLVDNLDLYHKRAIGESELYAPEEKTP